MMVYFASLDIYSAMMVYSAMMAYSAMIMIIGSIVMVVYSVLSDSEKSPAMTSETTASRSSEMMMMMMIPGQHDVQKKIPAAPEECCVDADGREQDSISGTPSHFSLATDSWSVSHVRTTYMINDTL